MANFGAGLNGAASGAATGSMFGLPGALIGGGLGALAGLFGGGSSGAVVPRDIAGLRGQNIDLLHSLLQPGAFDQGGFGSNYFFGGGVNGVSQFLNQPSPEMRAFDTARPILEGMLTGTGPQFERDIGAANSQGGRFGSANAILRGEALRNLFNQRTQTASTLGALANQAGSSQFNRLMDVQNQRLQLLSGLLGMSGQATLSLPVQQQPTGFQNFMDALKVITAAKGSQVPGGGGGNANVGRPDTFAFPGFTMPNNLNQLPNAFNYRGP